MRLPDGSGGKESASKAEDSGFPGSTSGKEPACQCRRHKRCGLEPWVEIPWRRAWQPTPVFLPGESHGKGSLAGRSSWGCRESDTTEQLNTHTHPSLAYLTKCRKVRCTMALPAYARQLFLPALPPLHGHLWRMTMELATVLVSRMTSVWEDGNQRGMH